MVRSKISTVVKALAGAALMVAAGAAQAATPVYTGSGANVTLTGATNVQVNGAVYTVDFLDGNCNGLFNSCSASSFAFSDSATASSAASALLSQVFIAFSGIANFDSIPDLTKGCSDWSLCKVYIPYAVSNGTASLAIANNASLSYLDGVSFGSISASSNTNLQSQATFARFTPSAVPEPSTWLLMMAGFAVAGFALRRGGATERRAIFA